MIRWTFYITLWTAFGVGVPLYHWNAHLGQCAVITQGKPVYAPDPQNTVLGRVEQIRREIGGHEYEAWAEVDGERFDGMRTEFMGERLHQFFTHAPGITGVVKSQVGLMVGVRAYKPRNGWPESFTLHTSLPKGYRMGWSTTTSDLWPSSFSMARDDSANGGFIKRQCLWPESIGSADEGVKIIEAIFFLYRKDR